MNTSIQMRHVPNSVLFRWGGRAAGVVLLVIWLVMFVQELILMGAPSSNTYIQAAALGFVFAGYVTGWFNELAGGVMAIVGTFVFLIVCAMGTNVEPHPEMVWFAAPGVCYLLAHYFERSENATRGSHET